METEAIETKCSASRAKRTGCVTIQCNFLPRQLVIFITGSECWSAVYLVSHSCVNVYTSDYHKQVRHLHYILMQVQKAGGGIPQTHLPPQCQTGVGDHTTSWLLYPREDLIPIGDFMHSIIAFFFVWMPGTLCITLIMYIQTIVRVE